MVVLWFFLMNLCFVFFIYHGNTIFYLAMYHGIMWIFGHGIIVTPGFCTCMQVFFEVHDYYSVSVIFLGLLTSTVLIAEIREAPHVSQSDDFSGHREDKLQLVAPLSSFCHLHLGVRDDLQRTVQPVRRVHLGRDLFLSCWNIKACFKETRDCYDVIGQE